MKLEKREARIEQRKADASKNSWPCVISTETPVLRSDYDGQYREILRHDPKSVDLSRAPLPVLQGHDSSQINIGQVRNLRFDGSKLRGELVLGQSARAQELAADVHAGLVSGLSVGYRIEKSEFDPKTKTLTATLWAPYECSIVSCPADINAGINRSLKMENENTGTVSNTAVETERSRVAEILRLCKSHDLGDEFATRMINEGTSLSDARSEVLEMLAARSEATPIRNHVIAQDGWNSSPRISIIEDAKDKYTRAATSWLLEKAGVASVVERAAKMKGENVDLNGGPFRGMTLPRMAEEFLALAGARTRGQTNMQIVTRALSFRTGGMATTGDFSTLLENALGKVLLAAYETTTDTWSRFCKIDTVSDFRTASRYRNGSFGTLDSITESSEFRTKSIPDGQKLSISTATRGNIISISRQALVNDDMGAFSDLAVRFGRAARLSIETDVYALLAQNSGLGPTQTDTNPFMHSSRGNVNGTGSALSVAGLDADRVVLAAQKDISSNDYLDLKPAVLLVPSGLGGEARVLNSSQYDTDGTKLQKPNKVVGLFRDVIDTGRLTGTRRYLFVDPMIAPAMVVAFLEGTGQSPYMESQQGFEVDGLRWKCRIDYLAQMFDPKGVVTNAGA
jgi:HK97 family phage prohead protease